MANIRCNSDRDCPRSDPVCSEWGYCQCASYQPGGAACYGQGGGGDGGRGSDEDTCSGNAPSVGGIYCLNERGRISCRNSGDCPAGYEVEETEGEKHTVTSVTYSCNSDYSDAGVGKECIETKMDSYRFCNERGECGGWLANHAFGAGPLTKSSATAGQTVAEFYQTRSLLISLINQSQSGCVLDRPCRYRGNLCGKVVGLGYKGRRRACPKTPSDPEPEYIFS